MPRKKEEEKKLSALSAALRQISRENTKEHEAAERYKMVDIITFCNDPRYLDLQGDNNRLNLFVSQTTILKCFYMGTKGNEDIKLDDNEWEWLNSNAEDEERDGITYEKNIKDVIKKMMLRIKKPEDNIFTQLVLVLGRRASKTLMASIISVYEIYKLLVINNGDPHSYYNLPGDDEIAIINVALSEKQAGRLFGQIQARLRNAPFFKGRIAKETTSEIRLYTDKDLEKKKNANTTLSIPGSIVLLCGHSNPDSLAGYNAILILFDEIAFYDETGKVTGKYFFNRLKPSLSKFFKYQEGKIVMISSPNSKMGIFYEMFALSKKLEADDPEDRKIANTILSFQLPTWRVNPDVPYNEPELVKDRKANPEMFAVEYGAQFGGGSAMTPYFDPGLIDRCIRGDLSRHSKAMPKFNYYMHVDPAKGGNNYAAVLVAKERYTDTQGKKRNRVHLAGAWVWRPVPGQGLQFHLIDKEVIKICSIFHPLSVTYDDYHSKHSIETLRSHGVHTRQMSYNRSVKNRIYQNLYDMMCYQPQPELFLYNDGGESALLISELKELKKKIIQRGISIVSDKHGDIKSDDLADCLAGACCSATEGLRPDLPATVTAHTVFF